MSDPFEPIREAVRHHEAELAKVMREAEPIYERYRKADDAHGAYAFHQRLLHQTDDMRQTIYQLRLRLPPFTTRNDAGFYERHEVTPENAHLFSRPV